MNHDPAFLAKAYESGKRWDAWLRAHRMTIIVLICQKKSLEQISDLNPVAAFKEEEGISLVINKETADENGIKYDSVFRLISLHVHSSLDAVGLTAAFSGALGKAGISANVVAAYYHDHIFVPADKTEQAVKVLEQLSKQNENKH